MMKKLLSFIWPQTTKIDTDFNGILEVTWINGRKVLDSKNANYSYGTLQRILETGLSKIDIKNSQSILLLGLGGGSIVHSLKNKFDYKGTLDVLEIDEKVISIAKNEFNLSSFDNINIFNCDALDFVNMCTSHYDVIIVDLFIDQEVPSQFLTEAFSNHLAQITNPKGTILYNLGINLDKQDKQYQVITCFKNHSLFTCTVLEHVTGTNTLMIAKKSK
ncbi:spermidine synthase [Olleya sp. HaHaR_3_96]|uniref:spermidine synthase n=1 Tax=Olleya sp. HaHaR_3_96 TaxID=2745560 RepID=UPI001C4FD989|nr:fused MFS/spermidine synthase [Olleya sp. HaHaR_3_96]QXP59626.1 fused MFS/spermidine synthase [Olleya sp. HaHaR_3_96]